MVLVVVAAAWEWEVLKVRVGERLKKRMIEA